MNAISQSLSIAPTHNTLSLPELKCAFYCLWAAPISDVTFTSCRCHSSSSMSLSVRLPIKPLGTYCTLLSVQCVTTLVTPTVTARHSFACPALRHCHSSCHSHICHVSVSHSYQFHRQIYKYYHMSLPHIVTLTPCHSHTFSLSHVPSLPYLK